MGGSSLGAKAIYSFLKSKIRKEFSFYDNLINHSFKNKNKKKLNIVISKSGNTLETIVNLNTLKNIDNSIFITEKNSNYLRKIALELTKQLVGRFSKNQPSSAEVEKILTKEIKESTYEYVPSGFYYIRKLYSKLLASSCKGCWIL